MEKIGRNNSSDNPRLARLYPFVSPEELPLSWSNKEKAPYIALSEENLRVFYRGNGKPASKEPGSVLANMPIPHACLLYYFEIKILSKGRDGYMGIGICGEGVQTNRLPGWDKKSYGYHGDDGNSFCSSGTGQSYGPIFTTNDVIGCAYNIVENNCYYTKNGLNLGIAFHNLANIPLYPVVGLQTPGEEVEANFGTQPFVYDIEEDMKALRLRITASIVNHPVKYIECQTTINKLILSWLIHNGYCSTAEVFSSATRQEFKENVQPIKQRLKIQQLVLSGKINEAIQLTNRLYPEVLSTDLDLLFALKCRQFVEMIYDAETANCSNGSITGDCNGNSKDKMELDEDDGEEMDDPLALILAFGKDLHVLYQELETKTGASEKNRSMLQDAFGLLAYSDPEKSPIAWQLDPSERESVCQRLNNAIVQTDAEGCCATPPLEEIIKHTKTLLRLNGQCGAWLLDNL